jgi:hydrogenase expression/formation protein HypE
MRSKTIRLGHGGGGRLTGDLIQGLLLPAWSNPQLSALGDSAIMKFDSPEIAFTTDSYVVSPPFFPGGDIGHLAVCGTTNDLAVAGARPEALSCALIIEEGFPMESLERIVESMKQAANQAGVSIVTGDTKVVGHGKGDGIFINTAGIGPVVRSLPGPAAIQPGDHVLLSGTLGDHSLAVLKARGDFALQFDIESDCAALWPMISTLMEDDPGIRFMRDPTRGGLTNALCEITAGKNWGIALDEQSIPVQPQVTGLCELLGYDPLTLANEGKVILVAAPDASKEVLQRLRNHPLGSRAAMIGTVTGDHPGRVGLRTSVGGTRVLDIPLGEDLPRIC